MTEEDILRWELAYDETAKQDFARRIYEECDKEDDLENNSGENNS